MPFQCRAIGVQRVAVFIKPRHKLRSVLSFARLFGFRQLDDPIRRVFPAGRATHEWGSLFREKSARVKANRIAKIFGGKNFGGKPGKQRVIFVHTHWLPADCIEVFWNDRQLQGLDEIQRLTDQFRKVWKLPPPTELDLPVEPPPEPEKPAVPKTEPTTQPKSIAPQPQKPAAHSTESNEQTRAQQETTAKTEPSKGSPGPTQADSKAGEFEFEFKQAAPEPEPETASPPKPPRAKIDPRLFQIQNPLGLEWKDSDPLINFGNEDSDADVWRIRDASEGLLIFGAVGSGKTSGSGSAVTQNFLRAGYGELVLTVKPDEASRWLRMCERTGRSADCIHVTYGSGHKLNILDYETQRTGKRLSITDDLIALFRCIIGVTSGSKKNDKGDDFWTLAPNRLMARLFDTFLLADEPISLDSLIQFVESAPTNPAQHWQTIKGFAEIINRARQNSEKGTLDDKDDFRKAFHYWTKAYPNTTEVTRSGIITGFSAMADALNARGIKEIIGMETNVTPEMILSGKIVILDFPIKGSVSGGLMMQAAWKLLFQQAIERRADKNKPTARPVFLWEDEGHEFFSHHDVRFQPTARDCRVSHVIMSQNIHNFLHLGHDAHAVYAVFAAMNTYIFHTNGDHETNSWASQRIGDERKTTLKSSGLFRDIPKEELSFFENRRPDVMKSAGGFTLGEEKKRAVPPEDFGKLKKAAMGLAKPSSFGCPSSSPPMAARVTTGFGLNKKRDNNKRNENKYYERK